jgi:hypothetical protein
MTEYIESNLLADYSQALQARQGWESLWQECYDYALMMRRENNTSSPATRMRSLANKIYDSTAADAVEQLAAMLLAQLTPMGADWVRLVAGADVTPDEAAKMQPQLQAYTQTLLSQLQQGDFVAAMHQALLDLVTLGTAYILVEPAPIGQNPQCQFFSVSPWEVAAAENATYYPRQMAWAAFEQQFPDVAASIKDKPKTVGLLQVMQGTQHQLFSLHNPLSPTLLASQILPYKPLIQARWLPTMGDVYGRSPLMKVLPDVRTANKVVELILKNASIAVTGIWQAEDDGVLNPANIKLVPGAIIPKAQGSSGLTPLQMPSNFNVSQLVLQDLQQKIRHALYADKIAPQNTRATTATESLLRAQDVAQLFGGIYARLQQELLQPLVMAVVNILQQRGALPNISIDGRYVALQFQTPFAKLQQQQDLQATLQWLQAVQALGVAPATDMAQVQRFLAQSFGVPNDITINFLPSTTIGA